MDNAKKTLYEILEVPPGAALPEIKAAHRSLSRKLLLGKPGLSREDIDFNLKLIDLALSTLSDQASRDAYDAKLAASNAPSYALVPREADATSLQIAAAIEQNQKFTAAIDGGHDSPLKVMSAAATSSVSALKKIVRVIAALMILGVIIKVSTAILAGGQPGRSADGVSKADEKVRMQEYYQTHGVRPASRIEADLLEVENRRKENEQREAAREKKQEEDRYRQFVEDSRRVGREASENVRQAEEQARYEEERRKQQLERERREREMAEREAERDRLEQARQRAAETKSE
ncbi:MAG: hypothetical protein NT123_11525 [Proteobacteria bacterium]|nr:hypothetical protein [Pseudomonadota bacterium]